MFKVWNVVGVEDKYWNSPFDPTQRHLSSRSPSNNLKALFLSAHPKSEFFGKAQDRTKLQTLPKTFDGRRSDVSDKSQTLWLDCLMSRWGKQTNESKTASREGSSVSTCSLHVDHRLRDWQPKSVAHSLLSSHTQNYSAEGPVCHPYHYTIKQGCIHLYSVYILSFPRCISLHQWLVKTYTPS